jgi:hypothetical protein
MFKHLRRSIKAFDLISITSISLVPAILLMNVCPQPPLGYPARPRTHCPRGHIRCATREPRRSSSHTHRPIYTRPLINAHETDLIISALLFQTIGPSFPFSHPHPRRLHNENVQETKVGRFQRRPEHSSSTRKAKAAQTRPLKAHLTDQKVFIHYIQPPNTWD